MRASIEGNGHRTATEAYRNQGIDLDVRPWTVKVHRSVDAKYPGYTPLGTSVGDLVRSDHLGVLASRCGYCGDFLGLKLVCSCGQGEYSDDV